MLTESFKNLKPDLHSLQLWFDSLPTPSQKSQVS